MTDKTSKGRSSLVSRAGQNVYSNSGLLKQPLVGEEQKLRLLYQLLTERFYSYEEHCHAYLDAGLKMFSADLALLFKRRLLHGDANIEYIRGCSVNDLPRLDDTHQWYTQLLRKKVSFFSNSSETNPSTVFYNGMQVDAFLCAPLFTMGQFFGGLCFLRTTKRAVPFATRDLESLKLMAKGVAKMIELQRTEPVTREQLQNGFATDGVKTLEAYVQQARLPEVYGIPGKVVEVLQKRISKSSLSIDFVAADLNFSKRTLQRRLQQQNISFAQLRDQVRFHFAIIYLIENSMSIDSISGALDFSDRTSFTNAFKRWTGLSPSTFRKLFRDYA